MIRLNCEVCGNNVAEFVVGKLEPYQYGYSQALRDKGIDITDPLYACQDCLITFDWGKEPEV